jgi:hypothetical protein
MDYACEWCGKIIGPSHSRFCNKSCSAKWRMKHYPISPEKYAEMGRKTAARLTGVPAPQHSERMRLNNPSTRPEVIAKIKAARLAAGGYTFLSRGGNGKLTEPQKRLATATGLPMEHTITLEEARKSGLFESLPTHYKVDLACPALKISIEIDGESHKTKRWRFLDKRKTAILEFQGWCVLRFWNKRVMSDLDGVIAEIRSCMISRSRVLTPTSQTGS